MTGQILMGRMRVAAQPEASAARTVMLVPAPFYVVGVPLMRPALLSVRPAGSVPLVIDQV